METMVERISEIGIIPVIKIKDAAGAVPLAQALARGGLPAAEITKPLAHHCLRAETSSRLFSVLSKSNSFFLITDYFLNSIC